MNGLIDALIFVAGNAVAFFGGIYATCKLWDWWES